MSRLVAAIAAMTLSACTANAADTPTISAAVGTQASAPLRQTARLGRVSITPTALIEDSRCPVNARCVWAGRLVIALTAVTGDSSERLQATLGAPFMVGGKQFALVAAAPEKSTGAETAPEDYRFMFEAR